MYPDLSYFFHDLIGTDRDNWLSIFKTFGLFLLLAFVVAAWLLKKELKRRADIGQLKGETVAVKSVMGMRPVDYLFNGLFGFLLGYKIPYAISNLDLWKQDPGAVLLTVEGNIFTGILAAAALLGFYYWKDRQRKTDLPETQQVTIYPSDRVPTITFAAAIGGVVGAKVFAIIEYLPEFFADPIGTFFSGSGLAIYGGLIGGFLAVYWVLHRNNIPKLPVMDAVAPALIIAYGVGRIGCQLSGDGDWGIVATAIPEGWFLPDWLWSYDYPHNVIDGGGAAVEMMDGCKDQYCTRLAQGHYPTPIYETTMAFTIGAILWSLRKKLTAYLGGLFSLYLFLNGVERFCIEVFRVNDQYDVLGLQLTQAQLIAIGFMLCGIIGGWLVWRNHRPENSTI
jgi:prolipoprotein diacylglyceryltransferase